MYYLEKFKKIINKDHYKFLLFFLLIFLCFFSINVLKPQIAGDGLSYVDSIKVIKTGEIPDNFVPNRLLTTYLGLLTIILFTSTFNSLFIGWIFQNMILYIIFGLFFYLLAKKVLGNEKIAFISTILIVTNYAVISFGLGYLMDMGGWTFYIMSIYFSYIYFTTLEKKWMWFSAISIGIGGMFKEYAFLGYIVLFLIIIILNWRKWKDIFKNIFFTSILSFFPIILINIYIIRYYDYSYLSWFNHQKTLYPGQNVLVEFIKSFGSLYNFGWFLFLPGFYILCKKTINHLRELLFQKNIIFIWLILISIFPVFLWPPVTRVLFVTMPFIVIVSGLFLKKIESKLWIIISILSIYFICSYLMDSFILNFVNLPF